VFIFHKRIGKTLAPGSFEENDAGPQPTGTQWEFFNALQSDQKPLILLYRDTRNPDYDKLKDGTPLEFAQQLEGLENFFTAFADNEGHLTGSVEEFSEDQAFLDQLKFELENHIKSLSKQHNSDNVANAIEPTSPLIPRDYLDNLIGQTGSIELLGATDANESIPSSLPAIYVPAITTTAKHKTAGDDNEEIEKLAHQDDSYQLILTRIGEQCLYLYGHPGSGKTIFCQWLAHCVANRGVPRFSGPEATQAIPEMQEELPPTLAQKIPVLIRLRDFATYISCPKGNANWGKTELLQAIHHWLTDKPLLGLAGDQFQNLLNTGSMLLILDGVDEVAEERTDKDSIHYPRHALLTGLADALPHWQASGNRILMSSRPYGINAIQRQQIGLPMAELLPLDQTLQELFVHRWYQAADARSAPEFTTELVSELQHRSELAELKNNPLLLTAICVKFKEGKRLPRDIHDLYNSITNQVLYNRFRESERERDRIRWRLEALALGMHAGTAYNSQSAGNFTPQAIAPIDTLRQVLAIYVEQNPSSESGAADIQAKLNELLEESGLLLSRSDGNAEFYHQDFRDFLAAECWSNNDRGFASAVEHHGLNRDWRRMLGFLFAKQSKTARGRERALSALDTLARKIRKIDGEPQTSAPQTNGALLLADCYAIAFGDNCIDQINSKWAHNLRQVATEVLTASTPARDRNELFLKLGRMGWDTRAGVGLDGRRVPDIEWVHVAGHDSPFYISRYLITTSQYQAFLDASNGYTDHRWWTGFESEQPASLTTPNWEEPNAPRESVSWYEAIACCRWLETHLDLPLQNGEISLPTEYEWVTAYSGDIKTRYPWSGDPDPQVHANFDDSEIGRTSVVGLFPQGNSICGVSDMAGNVWEWMENKYDAERQSQIGTSGDSRSLRGGAFYVNRRYLRAAGRDVGHPGYRADPVGFRVVCRPHRLTTDT